MKFSRRSQREPKPRVGDVLSQKMERDTVMEDLDRMVALAIKNIENDLVVEYVPSTILELKTALAILAPNKLLPEEHPLSFYSDVPQRASPHIDDAMILLHQFPDQRTEINNIFKHQLEQFQILESDLQSFYHNVDRVDPDSAYGLLFLLPQRQEAIREIYKRYCQKHVEDYKEFLLRRRDLRLQRRELHEFSSAIVVAPELRVEIQALVRSQWEELKVRINGEYEYSTTYLCIADLKIIFSDEAIITSDSHLVLRSQRGISSQAPLPERSQIGE